MVYNNGSTDTVYYYIKNLQGDVTMIVDQNIGIVAKYTYDAWGKLLSVTNESGTTLTSGIGIDNPIRYRGYYYDSETNWYYLGSRYYDSSVCRFINADDVSTVTNSATVTDKNLYAYCDNNPVMRIDIDGDFWGWLKSIGETVAKAAVVVAAVAVTVACVAGSAALTIYSGGAGAAAIPVAIAISETMISVATAAVATAAVGTATAAVGSAGEQITAKRTSANQMNKQVKRGQAPKGVDRVDAGNTNTNTVDHTHFTDGTSLNYDGTVHDRMNGIPKLTNKIRKWFIRNGWNPGKY